MNATAGSHKKEVEKLLIVVFGLFKSINVVYCFPYYTFITR